MTRLTFSKLRSSTVGLLLAPALVGLTVTGTTGCRSPAPDAPDDAATAAGDAGPAEGTAPPTLPDVEFVLDDGPIEDASAPGAAGTRDAAAPLDDPAVLSALRDAVAQAPADVAARRNLAVALLRAGLVPESIPHFERLVELEPGPRSLFELASTYSSASRLDAAWTTYERVLAKRPEDPRVLHNMANVAVKRGDPELAATYYRRAIEADPTYALAYLHLGDLLDSSGQPREAYAVYLTIVDRFVPRTPHEQSVYNQAVYRLGTVALALDRPDQAEQLLSQVVRAVPDHSGAHYALAQALLRLGRTADAERELETHMALLSRRRPTAAAATVP